MSVDERAEDLLGEAVRMKSSNDRNQGQAACALLIAALEAELATVAALREKYVSGELDTATLVPLRHFCAGLVESAVELARTVSDLSAPARVGSADLSASHNRRS
jgi:hypothetical protein